MPPRLLISVLLALLMSIALRAQDAADAAAPDAEAAPVSFVDRLREAGLEITSGPATVALGTVAELDLPADHHSVDAGSIERFYELTENVYSGNEAGVILGPGGWMLYFDYEEVGYVKDDEKDQLDAAKLLETLQKNQAAANEFRAKQGWDEMRMAGWAAEPHYDPQTNNLKWALRLTSSSDNHQEEWINESIRLLGRGGVMNVTLVTAPDTFAADSRVADGLLARNFGYVAGQKYAEFREGDKLAEYGLAALVLGGAGAVAFKLGFFQKFWKVIVGVGLAVLAAARKVWNKITGRNPA